MSVLPIRLIGDPVLRQKCRILSVEELASKGIQTFIDDLIETMRDANGAGLAAPQVGCPIAVAAVCIQDNPRYPYKPNFPLTVFVNPKITVIGDDYETIYEGCLSVPNLRGEVARAMRIRIEALDRHGEALDFEIAGLTAGTFQHEFDHLEGTLFIDRVTDPKTLCTWSNFETHLKDRFVQHATDIVKRYGS